MGMQNSKYLIAGYPFEGNANDIKGVNNGTVFGVTFVDGKIGKAANLDGVDDYVNFGDHDNFSFTTGLADKSFSISMWLYLDRTSNQFVVGKRGASGIEWQISFLGQKIGIYTYSDNIQSRYIGAETQSNFPQLSWNHIALTYDGSGSNNGFSIYLNANKMTLNRYAGGVYAKMINTNQPVIAGINLFGFYLKGKIDLLKFHNKALAQSEIQRDYLNLPIL